MTDKELMQQALDALGLAKSSHNMVLSSDPPQSAWRYYDVDMKLQETITALDKRLAQPKQEPVAKYSDIVSDGKLDPRNKFDSTPQRPWVGLTDEEIAEIASTPAAVVGSYVHTFARAIEAKLRSKNT